MFTDGYRERAAALGIDLDESYRRFQQEIRMGGPVYQRLCGDIVNAERTRLSPRETEVLELCAAGLYVPAIAKRLFISSGTVRTHCSNIREKLGTRTITHAVAIAYRQGQITAEHA